MRVRELMVKAPFLVGAEPVKAAQLSFMFGAVFDAEVQGKTEAFSLEFCGSQGARLHYFRQLLTSEATNVDIAEHICDLVMIAAKSDQSDAIVNRATANEGWHPDVAELLSVQEAIALDSWNG